MAVCSITEFPAPTVHFGARAPVVNVASDGVVEQTAKTIGAAAASAAFADTTRIVRLAAEAQCFVSFGTAPVADANSIMLTAGAVEYFEVPVGQDYKVSVYDGSS